MANNKIPFPNNPVTPNNVEEMIHQLQMVFCKYGIGIPYSFDGTLTLEAKFNVLYKTVLEFFNDNKDLIDTWNELYNWIKNYFDNLDVQEEINNKLDEMASTGQLQEIVNQFFEAKTEQINQLQEDMDQVKTDIESIKSQLGKGFYRVVTVGKQNCDYTSINAALNANTFSNENPLCVLVCPGDYNEQIVQENKHGLTIRGFSAKSTRIHYNGTYPDCTMHLEGDICIQNLTVESDNPSVYAIHCDPSNHSDWNGEVIIDNCIVKGGSSAVGFASGQDFRVTIKNCILSSKGQSILYMHNSPYAYTGQQLTVINNYLEISSSNLYGFIIDDAAYTTSADSKVRLVLYGNTHNYDGWLPVRVRQNTAAPGADIGYIPHQHQRLLFNQGCYNFGIPGIDYLRGQFNFVQFGTVPATPTPNGQYIVVIPVPFNCYNFGCQINRVEELGNSENHANDFAITIANSSVSISTKNASYAGKTLTFNGFVFAPKTWS